MTTPHPQADLLRAIADGIHNIGARNSHLRKMECGL